MADEPWGCAEVSVWVFLLAMAAFAIGWPFVDGWVCRTLSWFC